MEQHSHSTLTGVLLYLVDSLLSLIIPPANFLCWGYSVFRLSVSPSICVSIHVSLHEAGFLLIS